MGKKGIKVNWKTINTIRNMKKQGYSIRDIARFTKSSTKTVQKYLNEEIQEPEIITLSEEIDELRKIIQEQENRIRVVESKMIDSMGTISKKITTEEHTRKEPVIDKLPLDGKEYYTVEEAMKRTGYAERTIQKKCQKLGFKKIDGKYRLTKEEIQKIQKAGTKHDPVKRSEQ
jgi:lambda repressor-like predicted transcriptional regulator